MLTQSGAFQAVVVDFFKRRWRRPERLFKIETDYATVTNVTEDMVPLYIWSAKSTGQWWKVTEQ